MTPTVLSSDPFVGALWFSAADAKTIDEFNPLIGPATQKRLEQIEKPSWSCVNCSTDSTPGQRRKEVQMSDERIEQLSAVFRLVFDLPPDVDPKQTRQMTTPAWDSLGHVSLITAIESEFAVEILTIDSLDLTSFEAATLILEDLLE